MGKSRVRQQWIEGTFRPCQHNELDEIKSEGGKVIAERCAACQLLLAQYGPCAGCGKQRRLVHFVQARRAAYCTGDCHQATIKAEKAAREAALADAMLRHLANGRAARAR